MYFYVLVSALLRYSIAIVPVCVADGDVVYGIDGVALVVAAAGVVDAVAVYCVAVYCAAVAAAAVGHVVCVPPVQPPHKKIRREQRNRSQTPANEYTVYVIM